MALHTHRQPSGTVLLFPLAFLVVFIAGAMNPSAARSFEAAKLDAAAPVAAILAAALAVGAGGFARLRPAWPFALLLAVLCAGTVASAAPFLSLVGGWLRSDGLAAWCVAIVAGASTCLLASDSGKRREFDLLVDAVLLSGAMPAAYGILQWAGLDHLHTSNLGTGWTARPGSTLGNASYFAGYLGLLVPVTATRALLAADRSNRLFWSFLSLLYATGIVAAQSRGATIGLMLSMPALGAGCFGLLGKTRRERGASHGRLAAVIATAALIALLCVPRVQAFLAGVPAIERLARLGVMDESQRVRIGIWESGAGAIRDARASTLALGAGLEVGHLEAMKRMPRHVLEVEGLGVVIDRMHNVVLDLLLATGIAGTAAWAWLWFLAWRSGRALAFPDAPRKARDLLTAAAITSVIAMGAGWLKDSTVTGWIAGGVGIAIAASAILALDAFRHRASAAPAGAEEAPLALERCIAVSLVAALIAAWIDIQINVTSLPERLVQFVWIGGLLGMAARGPGEAGPAGPREAVDDAASRRFHRLIALACAVAALPAFFPALHEVDLVAPSISGNPWRYVAPLAALAIIGWYGVLRFHAVRMFAWLPPVAILATLYFLTGWMLFAFPELPPDVRMCGPTVVTLAFAGVMLVFATPWNNGRVGLGVGALAGVALVTGSLDLRADVLSKTASWNLARGQFALVREQMRRATDLVGLPRHHSALGARHLEDAVTGLRQARGAEDLPPVLADFAAAEKHARLALARDPGDPLILLGLANALQIQSMRALRPLFDEQTQTAKSREAASLFERAIVAAPYDHVILRNAAQFAHENGDSQRAYALLDRMGALLAGAPEVYQERLRMAREAGDEPEFERTLEAARKSLGKIRADALLGLRQ